MNWHEILQTSQQWMSSNIPIVILILVTLIQWAALHFLFIHYFLFRKSVLQRPDGVRFSLIEKNLSFHKEQIDLLFNKLADLRGELSQWSKYSPSNQVKDKTEAPGSSLEASLMTQGEANLKRRVQQIKAQSIDGNLKTN